MDVTTAAGVITIVGSVLYIVAVAPMARLYGGRDPESVTAQIRAHWRSYVASQLLFAIGAIATGVGMALLAVWFVDSSGPLLPAVGAGSMLAGGAMWAVLSYDRTVNYERYFREYGTFPVSAWAWLVLTGIGLAVYGFMILGPDFPAWVAYVTWVLVGLQVVGALVVPKLVPPQIYYLATLLIGIVAAVSPFGGG